MYIQKCDDCLWGETPYGGNNAKNISYVYKTEAPTGQEFEPYQIQISFLLFFLCLFRCIVIHDCDVSVFRTFLSYLYGGVLATASMSLDDIVELLMVADRYETTSLRGLCEALLVERVKDASVFSLLQVADRYSARKLRVRISQQ